jgi:predicted Zn-dependent protease
VSIAYAPKLPEGNVNISKQSPLREFFKLLVGIAVTVIVVYVSLGFVINAIVPFIPVSVEKKLGGAVVAGFKKKTALEQQPRVQAILDTLLPHLDNNPFDITISVAGSDQVNAFALPGGHIVVFEGLLKEIESDNELAFVIGHELGHFVNRDHLRGMGRGLVLSLIALLLGNDSGISGAVINTLHFSEQRFSQKQESKADAVGLDLLYKTYGSTKGSVSFFQKLEKEDKISEFAYFFASHPSPQERIDALEKLIGERYSSGR